MSATPNQFLFTDGDYYQVVTATTAGETPVTAPAKFSRILIKKEWRWILTRLAHGHLLEIDGQMNKSAAKLGQARGTERMGLDDVVRLAANKEHRRQRPSVQTRTTRGSY